jgi:putative ABC transport system permease protein
MLTNYLKITLRNFGRQKVYAFINVFGLAVGIMFCAFIFLYVRDELTFDQFHKNGDRIVRVNAVELVPDGAVAMAMPYQPLPLADALRADVPEVLQTTRLMERQLVVRNGDFSAEETVLFADPSFFDLFTFPLKRGDAATALRDLNSIVLSEEAARAYFGDVDPLGRTMQVRFEGHYEDVVVTGVAKDVPGNSSIRFDYLMPFAKLPAAFEWIRNRTDNWRASSFFVYALLDERATIEEAQAKLPAFREKYYPGETETLRAEGRWTGDGPARGYTLQPISDIHLNPAVMAGLTPPSDPKYSYILGGIALALLLIACINFTTLAIGRSAGRAREIGIRKTVGAHRAQLMAQFWGEAVMMSLLALGVGIAMAELLLPTFNALAGKELNFDYFGSGSTLVALVGLMLLTGVVAGAYPALVLSRIAPTQTLRGRIRLGGSNALTKSLVVVQFVLSISMIIGTLVMTRQLSYLQQRHLGFDKEHLVVIPTHELPAPLLQEHFRAESGPDILGITATSSAFTHGWSNEGWKTPDGVDHSSYVYRVEANYMDVMEIELVAGRGFDPNLTTDSTESVLVNQAFVRDFGWEDPIGQRLEGFYNAPVVVGVFEDVNFRSLHQDVDPMLLTMSDQVGGLGHMLVRIAPSDVPATLDGLKATWQEVAPDVPFQFSFLDDDLGRQYASEQRWGRIVGYTAGFAVLIACLGLFGLAALSVAGRTNEIGIRKIMGASVAGVTMMLSRDFASLVVIGVVVAAPIAWLAMNRWLESFAFRIEISGWYFLVAGAIALAVALLTVSYQSIRAALADPVKALRS